MSLRTMLLSAVLVSGLAACDAKPTQVGPGAADGNVAEKAPASRISVELPPAISSSKQYRCADNSLVFVDFYADDRSASMRTEKDGPAKKVVAATAGETMTGEGYSLKGGGRDPKITVTTPAHPKPLSCHV
jgi:hypothetical protein